MGRTNTPGLRVGIGYDLHPLIPGRAFVLGGVTIPSEKGPQGHSDADPLLHALTDALLGAAGLGDIGGHFPDSDPKWRAADSSIFVQEAVRMIGAQGWSVVNVDANVILETPKVGPYLPDIRTKVASLLQVDSERVSLKAKRGEGVDAVGEGRAVACQVVCLLESTTR